MHITVTSVTNTSSSSIVEFTCQHGAGRGIWAVGIPQLGHAYDVEMECTGSLRIGVNTKVSFDEIPRIWSSERETNLVARIENLFDGDTASLRLGKSLIQVEYEGDLPPIGTWVEITVPQIELYDTGI